jgi:hypothetical protein
LTQGSARESIFGMWDSAIAILLGVLLIEMARFGGYVSANPPTDPTIARRYTWRFRTYAVVACIFLIAQGVRGYWASKEAEGVQSGLNSSIGDLKSQLQKSDTGRQVDDAYFKAKLEDYKQLQDLAPALMKIAEATENYTKKQYEVKEMSDAKLLDFTKGVVAKIRDLGGKCQAQEVSIAMTNSNYQAQSMTDEQKSQFWGEQMQRQGAAEKRNMDICADDFRGQILGDAEYARGELLNRVGGDKFMSDFERMGHVALDTMSYSPYEINAAGNYLEALANKLKQGGVARRQ